MNLADCGTLLAMKTVKIAELKAQLSSYLQSVRKGEELLVCNRNLPVARIVPIRMEDYSEEEQRLIARGVLTPPLKRGPKPSWPTPRGKKISDDVMEQVWREERGER